ncbi:Serine-type D-Ala-D-Ala carboxypeptidase [Frankia casuarinae]|uniref:Serine-type D-Ala-D-Ala carboxypeptidase n=1 Tax=Frankia casuarinae (strain DSM 45818 / CECT 9043 / HFP020203 / CcI3) TaxID=106370 RepID=Q2JF94_FRACC|nr:Serine-type D-Ala-D-Ala carboxypeptidase [Frankia casuarinae]
MRVPCPPRHDPRRLRGSLGRALVAVAVLGAILTPFLKIVPATAAVPAPTPGPTSGLGTAASPAAGLGPPAAASAPPAVPPTVPLAAPAPTAASDSAPPAGLTAAEWLVADAGSGAILAAYRPHAQDLPASTMKILTALTVLPGLPPDRVVTVDENAPRVDGTKVGLVPGVGYTVRDLATAMLISSGNDATMALVQASGGTPAVLQRMNALARSLGATDTVAGDPTGLDSPGQVTSVHDLAVLGRAALDNPTVRGYLTIPRASLAGRGSTRFEIQNHNALLRSYEGTIGVKNGYTIAAGATFVGAATRGGHTLIVALLRTAPAYGKDARALLDWGFAHADTVTPVGYLANPGATAAASSGPAGDRPSISPAGPGVAPTAGTATSSSSSSRHGVARAGDPGSDIGPITWIAIGCTVVACLLTALTHRAARVRRRQRRRRHAAAGLRDVERPSGRPPAPRYGHVSVTLRPAAGPDQSDLLDVPEGMRRRRNARTRAGRGTVPRGLLSDATRTGPAEDGFADDGSDEAGASGVEPFWEPGTRRREASGFGEPLDR